MVQEGLSRDGKCWPSRDQQLRVRACRPGATGRSRDALKLLRELLDAPVPDEVTSALSRAEVSMVERAEAERFLYSDALQPVPKALMALVGHYGRSFEGVLTPSQAAGFLTHLRYEWRLESWSAMVPKFGRWAWQRLSGLGVDAPGRAAS